MSDSGPEAVPVCYRHTDRETYVHCVRCDRPICPDCMRDAAVGFQCVECVKEGAKAVRAMSAPYETKKVRSINEKRSRPSSALSLAVRGKVTRILIGINIVAFLLQDGLASGFSFGNGQTHNKFTFDFSLIGDYSYTGASAPHGMVHGEYYRLVTAAFLHANILHIAMNMLALYQIGTVLERLLGTWRYLGLYFSAAVGGNMLVYVAQGANANSLGASTAIFGLFAAFYLLVKKSGGDTSQLVSLIVINLAITLFIPVISKYGHIGGLLAGGVAGLIFTRISPQKAQQQALLVVGFIAVMVVACVLKTQAIA